MLNSHVKFFDKIILQSRMLRRSIFSGLGDIWNAPFTALVIVFLYAIALALPLSFYLLVKNITLPVEQSNQVQMRVFLSDTLDNTRRLQLQENFHKLEFIEKVDYISSQQAWESYLDLQDQEGLDVFHQLGLVDNNPLPASFELSFSSDIEPDFLKSLQEKLESSSLVEDVSYSAKWTERLSLLLKIINQSVVVISCILILSLIVLLINSMRIQLIERRDEIEIKKLVGASNIFIILPFSMTSFWYGILGAILSCIFIIFGSLSIDLTIKDLGSLHNLVWFDLKEILCIILFSGCFSALFTVIVLRKWIKKI